MERVQLGERGEGEQGEQRWVPGERAEGGRKEEVLEDILG